MPNAGTKKTKSAPKAAILIASVLIGGLLASFIATKLQNGLHTLQINHTVLHVKFATTSQEQEKGLCCRDSLPDNQGMLFIYSSPASLPFWMKDTRIPLDMIWIDSNKKIIHIAENVQPSSYPTTYSSNTPAQYVLETNALYAKNHQIKIGDAVSF